MATKKVLGRGLGNIIRGGIKRPEASPDTKSTPAKQAPSSAEPKKTAPSSQQPKESKISAHGLFTEIAISKIQTSPFQARSVFSEDEISGLAESIAEAGLLQPILVRQTKDGYELLAGERRLRACKKLGMAKIVACVQTASDVAAAAKGLIENIQRANLNPIEEAKGFANLMANFNLTQDAVAQRIGKPRSSIANSCRLLALPQEIQGYISTGMISMGHAKVILSMSDKAQQLLIARRIVKDGLNVRSSEEAVKRAKTQSDRSTPGTSASANAQDAVVKDVMRRISKRLNASVELKHTPKKGKIIIEYFGNEDLQRILEIMGIKD